jgi:hypothetical protein
MSFSQWQKGWRVEIQVGINELIITGRRNKNDTHLGIGAMAEVETIVDFIKGFLSFAPLEAEREKKE